MKRVDDQNAGGVPCLDIEELREHIAEMENEGVEICSECVAEFYD
ncbi:hypothetical protein [Maridesulfovibrio salexigens]|uniref:Uncharacterized protein n=1 Tax=Maridesulfovibrio salexigens (strain ATCC 14822 / DSM 2638 / NCIMB 8403 / VKM B-1763) TaxID=526222 RepID=C6BUJ2_MARSD|nr:hypothetical protein [Maridesulfovibrio salexigens]ACS80001.1 hypothetical protein Desal_1941 [Maridesulfovibrio salexigens DSM 2638]